MKMEQSNRPYIKSTHISIQKIVKNLSLFEWIGPFFMYQQMIILQGLKKG